MFRTFLYWVHERRSYWYLGNSPNDRNRKELDPQEVNHIEPRRATSRTPTTTSPPSRVYLKRLFGRVTTVFGSIHFEQTCFALKNPYRRPRCFRLSPSEMTAVWEDSNNLLVVGYAEQDELVTYSVTVRTGEFCCIYSGKGCRVQL